MEPTHTDSPQDHVVPEHSENSKTTETSSRTSLTGDNEGQEGISTVEPTNEDLPLLSPQDAEDDGNSTHSSELSEFLDWDKEENESKSSLYLVVLTLSIGGLQIAYSVEMSNGSPYLLSLGMSKSLLALVWIAGPLSGTLVQPYIGIRSDNSRLAWGKRRPFMLAGALATALSLLALAWAKEITHGFLSIFGADSNSRGVQVSSIVFAVVLVYVLDIAINTVQAGIRAFIVDNAPTHQQESANAWAGLLTGFGNILGYLAGYVNLPKLTKGIFGNTQFKVLCVVASFALVSTVLISSLCIRERDPRLGNGASPASMGVVSFFKQVFKSISRLPLQIRRVCEVQFFSWMGWFPFLFYSTTYIGQMYVNPLLAANPNLTPKEIDQAWEDATRVGTFALLIFAVVSFTSNLLLPLIIIPSYRRPVYSPSSHTPLHNGSNTPDGPSAISAGGTSYFSPSQPSGSRSHLSQFFSACQIPWLTLRRAWLLSHIFFALCMSATFFITSVTAATVFVGLVGLPWALTLWAPFALISAEISKRDSEARLGNRDSTINGNEDQAGIVLGLHNVAISAPQILATMVSSAIFKAAQKPRGTPGDVSVAWVLRFGGAAALVAAYMTWRVGEEGDASRKTAEEPRNEEV